MPISITGKRQRRQSQSLVHEEDKMNAETEWRWWITINGRRFYGCYGIFGVR